ncbi:MAG TPA: hypothetical protein PKY81_08415 [bacterium]|nr:hypothetical protein [bacterium]HPN30968.1 hypothetical protein [bacterium]
MKYIKPIYFFVLSIPIATLFLYGSFSNQNFKADDYWHIEKWTFKKTLNSFFLNTNSTNSPEKYYRPFFKISLAIDYFLGGFNPKIYYWHNFVSFVIFIVSVLFAFSKLTESYFCGIAAASLTLCHPAMVEAVSWAAARPDIENPALFIWAFYFIINYYKTGKSKHIFVSILLFTISLLLIEKSLVFPLLAVFSMLIFQKKDYKTLFIIILIIAVYFAVRISVLSDALGYSNRNNYYNIIKSNSLWFLAYKSWTKLLFPKIYYIIFGNIARVKYLDLAGLSVLVIFASAFLGIFRKDKKHPFLLALVWLFVNLLPVWDLDFAACFGAGSRRLITVIPFTGLMIYALFFYKNKWKTNLTLLNKLRFLTGCFIMLILVIQYCRFTFVRNKEWIEAGKIANNLVMSYPYNETDLRINIEKMSIPENFKSAPVFPQKESFGYALVKIRRIPENKIIY